MGLSELPEGHTAINLLWRSRSSTATDTSAPEASSASTANLLITPGPKPPATAALTAAVEPSSSTELGALPAPLVPTAAWNASRVPEPGSRNTRGVATSSITSTGLRRRAHG